MDAKSQVQTHYLLSIVTAFSISMVVLFVLFNFVAYIKASVSGGPIAKSEPFVSLPIKEENKIWFIAGMVTLYLLEVAILAFFYSFVASGRGTVDGERKLAEKIFKDGK